MPHNKKFLKIGFSIIEFSIVVVVISALVGIVATASKISNNAKLASAGSLTASSPVKDIDGLILWLETTTAQSIAYAEAANGGTVSTWYDLSSNHYNATQSSSSIKPKYTTNTINGLPSLYFDGVDDSIQSTGLSTKASNSFSIFIVAQNPYGQTHQIDTQASSGIAGASGQKYIMYPMQSTTNGGAGISLGTNGISIYEHGDSYLPPLAVYNDTSAGKVSISPIIISWIVNLKQHLIYLNGLLVRTGLTSARPAVYLPESIGGLPAGNGWWGGNIGEVIIFDRALSPQEQKDVEQYLSKKWAI